MWLNNIFVYCYSSNLSHILRELHVRKKSSINQSVFKVCFTVTWLYWRLEEKLVAYTIFVSSVVLLQRQKLPQVFAQTDGYNGRLLSEHGCANRRDLFEQSESVHGSSQFTKVLYLQCINRIICSLFLMRKPHGRQLAIGWCHDLPDNG